MRESGYLENTIVIITSDEVRHAEKTSIRYHRNFVNHHGYLYIHMPDWQPQKIPQPFLQNDLPISIADLIGLDTSAMYGRSVFREYPMSRNYLFSNIYRRKMFIKTASDHLTVCSSGLKCKTGKLKHSHLFRNLKMPPMKQASPDLMRELIYYNDIRPRRKALDNTP